MRTSKGFVIAAWVGLAACGGTQSSVANPYPPGTPVDINGDGKPDGVAVDVNGDGISDGVDLNGDGKPDVPLPGSGGSTPTNTVGDGDASAGSVLGDGDGAITSPPVTGGGTDAGCPPNIVTTQHVHPEMLIVLDRSGSMAQNGRWDPSRNAVEAVTAQFDSQIDFGLMAFPGADQSTQQPVDCSMYTAWSKEWFSCNAQALVGGFGGGATCQTGSLVVPIGAMTAGTIKTSLQGMQSSGATPTAATLEDAHKLLSMSQPTGGADQGVVTAKYVLLVTDGQPNCESTDQQAVTDSVNAIKSMAMDGIKTYVIGYNTESGTPKTVMDQMAQAGGTGSTEHIDVENEQSLTDALTAITGKAISCTYVLGKPAENASYVSVQVDGKDVYLNQPNGWTLSDDKTTVTIQGDSCKTLSTPGDHSLVVNVECNPVIPI